MDPMESTGLYLSQAASELLAEHFPYTDDMAPLAFRFNRIMANRFYEILDFINMHYCTAWTFLVKSAASGTAKTGHVLRFARRFLPPSKKRPANCHRMTLG